MSFRSDLEADIVRFSKSMVSSDGFTLALPCRQSYTSLIKRQASRLPGTSDYLLTVMKKFWGGDTKLRSSSRCGNVRLNLDHSAPLDEAVTDFLYLDRDAVLITESDDLSSR